jgi:hypothetical protein
VLSFCFKRIDDVYRIQVFGQFFQNLVLEGLLTVGVEFPLIATFLADFEFILAP